jgi:adenosylcobinamide-GDP ribazoletransferase
MEALAAWWEDVRLACGLLTRLPVPGRGRPGGPLRRAAHAFPLVGALVGLIAAGAYHAALLVGLPTLAAALLALLAAVLATGALHEDGLADTADGFGGGRDRDHKLAIMRDSRIGAYGVLALIFAVGLKLAALGALPPRGVLPALVAAHVASRAVLPWVMWQERPARADGLAVAAGAPAGAAVLWSLGLGAAALLLALGPVGGLIALAAAAILAQGLAWLARRQVGGITGDVLGALQQAVEVAVLLVAASRA